jgi:hypothetical protein
LFRKFGDNGAIAARTGSAEALMLCDGISGLGKIEDLMPILGVCIDNDFTAAGTTGIRKVAFDLINFGFWDDLAGILDMPWLSAPFLAGGFTATLLLGRSGKSVLTGRGGRIGGVGPKTFIDRTKILHQGPQTVDKFARFAERIGVLWAFEKLLLSGHVSL